VRTNHDVNVRVQDKVALDGLPSECGLLALSNTKGLLFAGGNSDVRVHRLDQIHQLFEKSAKDAQPTSTPVATIALPARPVWVR
jgi:nucleoporin NUP159